MGIRKWLSETLYPQKVLSEATGHVILGQVEQSYGVRLTTSFADQLKVFNKDPVIKESITQFAQEVISTGIFTTVDEAYTATLPTGPNGIQWTAKECLDHWNKDVNLDYKTLQIAIELVAFGNSLWHGQNGFSNIPIESIDKAEPRVKTVPIIEEYNLRLTHIFGAKVLPFGTFIHFKTSETGFAPFGSGIILGLIAKPDNDVPSLWEIRKSTRKSMKEGFEKFSFGNELWVFDGLSDDKIEKMGKEVTAMKSTGQRIATNVKGDIKLSVPQRTQSYDKWIDSNHHEFLMALANPSLKLGLEQGFTKATAEAARELFEFKISSIRRIIKREIEILWITVLNGYGFDGKAVNARLHFGTPEIEYVTADLFKAVELRLITVAEARQILRDSMKWRLEEALPEVEAPVQPPVETESLQEAVKPQKVDINFNITSDPIKTNPLEVTVKTDPLKVTSKVEVSTKPLDITIKHETNEELVAEKIKTEKDKQALMKKVGKGK